MYLALLTLIVIWICSFWIMSTYNPYPFFPNFNAVCVVLTYQTTVYLVSEQSSVIATNDRFIFKLPWLLILRAKSARLQFICAWLWVPGPSLRKMTSGKYCFLKIFVSIWSQPRAFQMSELWLTTVPDFEWKFPQTELIGGICRYPAIYRRTLM